MTADYPEKITDRLKDIFRSLNLFRPMRILRYDAGERLQYRIQAVESPIEADVELEVQRFVGGGFAGQVYHVKTLRVQADANADPARFPLREGEFYALKILIPPSGFARLFRNLLFRVGFQAPFQLQVNPDAARAGAIWQKLIRRAVSFSFNGAAAVNDVHGTFTDHSLGSCGEISDWVDGRTWKLEVDDHLDVLKSHLAGKPTNPQLLGSPEFRGKRRFMKNFVRLLHHMGAHEFARQYEWNTWKSQPNCLKYNATDNDPEKGLVAVDFRAGLTLLPFLPMSPGDIPLIFKGLLRGSLVQFDRGNLKKLDAFIAQHTEQFRDLAHLIPQLHHCETIYRNSTPDFTHNHFRLLYSKTLWGQIWRSYRTGWRVRGLIGEKTAPRLDASFFKTLLFFFLGAIPFLGPLTRKLWARPDWRRHYLHLFSPAYFVRSMRGKAAEAAIRWLRDGRLDPARAQKTGASIPRFLFHLPFSLLPAGLHRFFTQASYFKERLYLLFIRPFRLYFSAPLREEWMMDMVAQGQKKRMLSDSDAALIKSQLKESYIQKYLRSLAVHVLTLPITQIVSVAISIIYVHLHPEFTAAQAAAAVTAILVLFQVIPISPGSLTRGLYVVYLVIRERNFRDYNIAVFLGFFKYIGYLAFPIQMAYRYPEMARFMAGHWATEAVHIVPVFGEGGAFLEHWVYNLFYNWPLTVRRRMNQRSLALAGVPPRNWHIPWIAAAFSALALAVDYIWLRHSGVFYNEKGIWWAILPLALVMGVTHALCARGASLAGRIGGAVFSGLIAGAAYSVALSRFINPIAISTGDIVQIALWNMFIFSLFAVIGTIIAEILRPDPNVKKSSAEPPSQDPVI